MALVLSLVALVLAAGEAKAAQQPPNVVQQPSTEVQQFPAKTSTEYSAATDKKVAEPVPEAPSVVSNTLETLFPAPTLLKGSTPLQSLPNPTPEPPALQPPPPAPADSLQKLQKPVSKLTGESTRPEDPEPPSAKPDSARQQNPAPPVPLGREVPDPVPDPRSSQPTLLPVSEPLPEPEPKKPIALQAASETLPLQAEEPSVTKVLEQAGMLASLPENVPANYSVSPIAPTSYRADQSIAASRAIIPVPLEGGLHSTTNLGHIKPSVSTSFAGSPEPSSNDTQKPLEDAPQPPEPPLAPPVGDAPLFSLGGAQTAPGGALALLLICIFASGMVLLRPNSKLHLASCTIPKPSSALLMPLERPG